MDCTEVTILTLLILRILRILCILPIPIMAAICLITGATILMDGAVAVFTTLIIGMEIQV